MLACRKHWFALPKRLQLAIWANYVPGQEITKTPTADYLTALWECIDWWEQQAVEQLGIF